MRPIDADVLRKRIEERIQAFDRETSASGAFIGYALYDVLDYIDTTPTVALETDAQRWRNPETDPPKVEEDVLILFKTACGGYGITTAHYEDGTVLSEKSAFYWEEIFEWGTYDEESDDYFIPKGWWEYRYFNQDDIYNNRVDAHVVGWMPLPPKEVKQ
jgi:hypothetical protein|nr:MAG TPA: hypothetical protein [Caudoviricetes sp.]